MRISAENDVYDLLEHIKNLQALLVCYRISARPTEVLMQKLDVSRPRWQEIQQRYEL